MQRAGQLQHEVPAMRILENEHRYLTYLAERWHEIVLAFQNQVYDLEKGKQQFTLLRQLLLEFKAPLKKHTEKEEKYFFPTLGNHIGFEQGPLVSIEEEHTEINTYIDHFLHHAEGDLSLAQMEAVARDAGEAFEVLMIHFVKEETVLFPMVSSVMKAKEQEELGKQLHSLIV